MSRQSSHETKYCSIVCDIFRGIYAFIIFSYEAKWRTTICNTCEEMQGSWWCAIKQPRMHPKGALHNVKIAQTSPKMHQRCAKNAMTFAKDSCQNASQCAQDAPKMRQDPTKMVAIPQSNAHNNCWNCNRDPPKMHETFRKAQPKMRQTCTTITQ